MDSNPPDSANPDSNKGSDSNPRRVDRMDRADKRWQLGSWGWQLLVEVEVGSWQLAVGMLKLMLHAKLAVI